MHLIAIISNSWLCEFKSQIACGVAKHFSIKFYRVGNFIMRQKTYKKGPNFMNSGYQYIVIDL